MNKWLELVRTLAPVILAVVPKGDKIAPLVPVILHGIAEAEAIKGATGEQKKAHVLELVQTGVTAANATGKVHLDPAELGAATSKGIDAVVQGVNAVHAAAHQSPS